MLENTYLYAKQMDSCSKVDLPWSWPVAISSEKYWSVFQNHTSAACCENLDFATLMECCFKIDFQGESRVAQTIESVGG